MKIFPMIRHNKVMPFLIVRNRWFGRKEQFRAKIKWELSRRILC